VKHALRSSIFVVFAAQALQVAVGEHACAERCYYMVNLIGLQLRHLASGNNSRNSRPELAQTLF
jgi:hypothetical protein